MFYDKYAQICKQKGISMSAAAINAGLSKSLVTKWKANKVDVPSPDVLKKLSAYFNMPVSELLSEDETASTETGRRPMTDDELMFALWGDNTDGITDADLEDVRRYAAFVKERKNTAK